MAQNSQNRRRQWFQFESLLNLLLFVWVLWSQVLRSIKVSHHSKIFSYSVCQSITGESNEMDMHRLGCLLGHSISTNIIYQSKHEFFLLLFASISEFILLTQERCTALQSTWNRLMLCFCQYIIVNSRRVCARVYLSATQAILYFMFTL